MHLILALPGALLVGQYNSHTTIISASRCNLIIPEKCSPFRREESDPEEFPVLGIQDKLRFTGLEEDIVNAGNTMLLLHCECWQYCFCYIVTTGSALLLHCGRWDATVTLWSWQYDASVILISAPLAFQKDDPSVIIKLNKPTCTDKLVAWSQA